MPLLQCGSLATIGRHHFGFINTITLVVCALLCCMSPAFAQRGGKPIKDMTKRDFNQDCMRSGCHGGLNETPWVHGPVAVGSCDVCHDASGPKNDHKFVLKRQKEKVCTYCHQGNASGKVVHKVVTEEGCMKCHDPHGGVKRNLLTTQNEIKLCTECHKPEHYTINPKLTLAKTAENAAKLAQTAMVPLVKDVKEEDLRKYQFIHKPITEGKCLVCHDAHSADHRGLIPIPERELCITCHEDWKKIEKAGLMVHTPARDNCLSCHMKHGGNVSKLLVRQPKDLCLSCHTHVDHSIKTGLVKEVKMVPIKKPEAGGQKPEAGGQKPEAGGQKPEAGEKKAEAGGQKPEAGEKKAEPGEQKAEPGEQKVAAGGATDTEKSSPDTRPPTLDTEAGNKTTDPAAKEKPKKKVPMKAIYVGKGQKLHKGITDVDDCMLCHEPHAAVSLQLVRDDIRKPCLSCHNEEIKTADKRIISNTKAEIENAKVVHGPVKDGKCLYCHKGHSSEHRSLLTATHPEPLYAQYNKDNYKLCFNCHDANLVEKKETLVTNFRDKKRNLHYVHIKDKGIQSKNVAGKKVAKGRTCNICHEMHAGEQKSLIKPDLPYGKGGWKLKIKFTQTKSGGSCLVACHKKQDYNNADPTPAKDETWQTLLKKKMTDNGYR